MTGFWEMMVAPIAMALVLVAIHSHLGFHVVKRGVIFVDIALAQMAALPLPESVDPQELGRSLREDHHIEVPITEFGGRPWVRVSIQGYNNRRDVSRLVTAVKQLTV